MLLDDDDFLMGLNVIAVNDAELKISSIVEHEGKPINVNNLKNKLVLG